MNKRLRCFLQQALKKKHKHRFVIHLFLPSVTQVSSSDALRLNVAGSDAEKVLFLCL